MTTQELDFLRESNNIEDEWDDTSLQDAIEAWQYLRHQMQIAPRHILQIHALLMESRTTLDKKDKGIFRTGPVWIGGKEAKPWFAVPEMVAQWCKDVNLHIIGHDNVYDTERMSLQDAMAKVHAEQAKEDHVRYEAIHPFFDGNGRTGRMLYNWQRLKCGLPLAIIKEKEKFSYYEWFR